MAGRESTPDYYGTLGVPRTATADQIKKAFRKLARTHHPDAGGDEAKFKQINEAYEVLGDEKKRKLYDQYGTADANRIPNGFGGFGGQGFGANMGGFGSWAEILESIRRGEGAFGTEWDFRANQGYQPAPRKGRDLTVTLTVSFDEAFSGTKKQITVRVPEREEQTLEVTVPAGAVDGGRLRFKGRGAPGANGGPAGDLLVTTRIAEHPLYERDGANVRMALPVSIAEAALGASVEVPAPNGKVIRVKVPAGSQPGTVLTARGLGAPKLKAEGAGDLILSIEVRVPTELTDEQRAALEQFASHTSEKVREW